MDDVSIDRCTPQHWRRYRDIRLRSLADAPSAFYHSYAEESGLDERAWRSRLTDVDRASLVAVRAGGDVGIVSVGPPTWDEQADPEFYDLGAFWVAPQARRREVARKLLDAALEHARGKGAKGVTLWVIGENPPAQRLYESAGFALTGRESEIPGRSDVEREMRLTF